MTKPISHPAIDSSLKELYDAEGERLKTLVKQFEIMTTESERQELRDAAYNYACHINGAADADRMVGVIARLEVAAKSFADSELLKDKARLDWMEKQEGLATCGFSFNWFSEYKESLREAIDNAMKNPAR